MKYLYSGTQDVRHRLHIPENLFCPLIGGFWVRLQNFKVRTGFEIYEEMRAYETLT